GSQAWHGSLGAHVHARDGKATIGVEWSQVEVVTERAWRQFCFGSRWYIDPGTHGVRGLRALESIGVQPEKEPGDRGGGSLVFVVAADSAVGVQVTERRALELIARNRELEPVDGFR